MLRVVGDFLQQQHPEVRCILLVIWSKETVTYIHGLFGVHMQRENIRNETIYELTLSCFPSTVWIKRFLNTQQSMRHLLFVLEKTTKSSNFPIYMMQCCYSATYICHTYICIYIHIIFHVVQFIMFKQQLAISSVPGPHTREDWTETPSALRHTRENTKQQWPLKQNWAVIKTRRIYEFHGTGGLIWILRMTG